jgi:hypothetical protein
LVKCETVIIPPETNIEERRLRITPSISETVDGRVIRYIPEKPNKTSKKFCNFSFSLRISQLIKDAKKTFVKPIVLANERGIKVRAL